MDGDTEGKLLEQLRGGDPAALEALMAHFGSRIYRLAYGITRNESDAEEVAQDVFLTLVRKGDTFEGRSALGSWIYRIATNAALNKRRGKRSEVETSLEEYLPAFEPDGHRVGDRSLLLADWSETPETQLLSRETRALLVRAIDEMPDRHRVVLVLRDVEGLSNEEAAAALGESVASVKSRLHRARMALRERLTRHLGPGRGREARAAS
ncbi:MAG: sigma-70 family RNA polymerase sigma factor [Candidatus Rokubacteria bacterium]|nr:sigma-70 family RNA polymerase sigma factor [Candidatus Rokubacteria bacterium]